ncbi:MAG: hypothetical protein FJX57_11310 [Alphaproteobacteria bacterium]|nr:hypothetical protein [Alphaproteobacteria bacterium]
MDEGQSSALTTQEGRRGLAKAFWGLGVLAGGALTLFFVVAAHLTNSILIGFVGFLAVWAWQAFAGLAIWRAAARFEGGSLWPTLARIAVVASVLCLGYGTSRFLGII